MAAYTFEASEQTIQVLSADIVRSAQRVIATAAQSGVTYALEFAPYPTDEQGTVIWTADAIAQQLAYWAGIWDQNRQVPGVTGIALSQEVQPDGRLQDIAVVYIASTSVKSSTSLTLGTRSWLPSVAGTTLTQSFPDAVASARAQLDALETAGGGGGGATEPV